ncbi:general transcription factor IIF subunit 1 isoform X2 [Palaemon carinicauda]|uniref:general transcription factor IIF subunit 1 isoform X2 n=1 Tax=Palaemon carinicauda TaxID=392227 RepID=UPI0035B5E352
MERKEKGSIQEYVVKAPKTTKKKFNMMRFHSALGIEFKTWAHAKMERENNMKEFRSMEDEMPKFGAGSEFGREQKEEARRKKFGIHMKKYRPEDQPWILTIGGKGGKKFKGIREGGVSENSSWYVFMQGKDGAFEAYPVEEWYNYKLIQRYKSLTAEEAEQHFERRNKIMNYFTVMKKDKNAAQDGDEDSGKSKKKELILSEMDDWMSDDESGDDERDEMDDDSDGGDKRKKKNKVQSKGRRQQGGKKSKTLDGDDSDEDCIEESDEFDDGAEHDYISSDSSDSEAEDDEVVRKELAGVDEADALRKLLNSDEEEEEEKEKEKEKEEDEEKKESEEKEPKDKKKKKKKKKDKKSDKEDSDGKTSDASDDDGDSKKKKKKDSKANGAGEPGTSEGGSSKRKMKDGPDSDSKKMRADMVGAQISTPGSDSGVTEEAIRRYLMRKPMTTTELLQKFKLKKTGLNSDQLVHSIAQILKRVNPVKQMVKGKMYLSIKM